MQQKKLFVLVVLFSITYSFCVLTTIIYRYKPITYCQKDAIVEFPNPIIVQNNVYRSDYYITYHDLLLLKQTNEHLIGLRQEFYNSSKLIELIRSALETITGILGFFFKSFNPPIVPSG